MVLDKVNKTGRDLYAKGYANTDGFIEWLHINVYKPLLRHYKPTAAAPDSERAHKPTFFQTAKIINEDANRTLIRQEIT